MPRLVLLTALVASFLLGTAVAVAFTRVRPDTQAAPTKPKQAKNLSSESVSKLILYAKLEDGYIEGRYFNQNPELKIVRITVEAVPKDEKNYFNKYSPRMFNVSAIAQPRSMSNFFQVETGALNPEFPTLKIVEARGIDLESASVD
jgi:hypothetical protein